MYKGWLETRQARLVTVRLKRYLAGLAYFEKWLVMGSAIGVASGLFATFFYWLLELSVGLAAMILSAPWAGAADFALIALELSPPKAYLLPLVVGLGALLGGLLVYRFAPEAEGHGTDAVIEAFHRRAGDVRAQVPLVKAVASALTVGFGGSGGVEGPSAQMGGGIGSLVAKAANLGIWDRRIAVVAGIAGALSAIFRAPMGMALFAVEVFYQRDMEVSALIPAIIASVVAYTVTAPFWGYTEIFPRIAPSPEQIYDPRSIILYMGLGVFSAPFAYIYVKMFYGSSSLFSRLEPRLPSRALKPFLGGLAAGVLGIGVPHVLGSGRGLLAGFLAAPEQYTSWLPLDPAAAILLLGFAKLVATSLSIGSGGSGGVFAPSIMAGALIGYSYGLLVSPESPLPPLTYAYLGMAAFFAAASKTPLATSVAVAEMSGSYHLLIPALLASVISRELTGSVSIYKSQMHHRPRPELASLEIVAERLKRVPEAANIKAADIAERYRTVRLSDPLRKALTLMLEHHQHIVPVVDDKGHYIGVLDMTLLHLLERPLETLRMGEVPLKKQPIVHVDDDLVYVVEQLINHDTYYLVVVNGEGKYYGVITVPDAAAAAAYVMTTAKMREKPSK